MTPGIIDTARDLKRTILNKRYQRFIVLTSGRTGSHMLVTALAQHSQVALYGEVFAVDRKLDEPARQLWENDPITYLEQYVYRDYARRTKAVGFKIHYYHCHTTLWESVWTYLVNSPVKVIHLRRDHLLRLYVSGKLAKQSGIYMATQQNQLGYVDQASLQVTPEEFLAFAEAQRAEEQRYNDLFTGHDTLQLTYEEMVGDFEETIARVCVWLDVAVEPVAPLSLKQVARPMSSVVANYQELRGAFANTPYARYFDE